MINRWVIVASCALVGTAGCAGGFNYGADGPRYVGAPTPILKMVAAAPDTIHVASFNVAFARKIDRAIEVLAADSMLRKADVLLLQEMDEPSTRQIAGALGMFYTYYPAVFHPLTKRDFGNAVLSRWPIVADAKILLPHIARFRRTQRTATAATLQIGDERVRVYSVHLGTPADVGAGARREQLRAVLADAERFPRVIVAGDMNNFSVGRVARESGYVWVTEKGPPTMRLWRWDHIFVKGLSLPDSAAYGAVRDNRGASDHRPIWAKAIF